MNKLFPRAFGGLHDGTMQHSDILCRSESFELQEVQEERPERPEFGTVSLDGDRLIPKMPN